MKLIATLLAASLLSSCALLKVPARTIQSVGRTFGVSITDSSIQGDIDPTPADFAVSSKKDSE